MSWLAELGALLAGLASIEAEMRDQSFRIVFAIFPGMTQLDFTGPYQFLSRLPDSLTLVASRDGGAIEADGLRFGGTHALSGISACDLIFVPGGASATEAALDQEFVGQIRRLALGARYITSICTGSLILGAAGLLRGRRATCHWAWRHLLPLFGAVVDDGRVVRDGNVITGGGVTAGIDLALTVLAEVGGDDLAQALQLSFEYAPDPPFSAGTPDLAPPHILEMCMQRAEALAPAREAEARLAGSRMRTTYGHSD